jgi:hypothetical protein
MIINWTHHIRNKEVFAFRGFEEVGKRIDIKVRDTSLDFGCSVELRDWFLKKS